MVRYIASLLCCNNTLTSLTCSPCFQPLLSLFCNFSVPSSMICISSSYLSLLFRNRSCRCSVVIAARLICHILSNLVCLCSAVSLSRRRLYCQSLLCLSLFSTPSIVPINHHQHTLSVIYSVIYRVVVNCTNHIWSVSMLQRSLWCNGRLYQPYLQVRCFFHIFWYMVHAPNNPLVWGSLRLAPIIDKALHVNWVWLARLALWCGMDTFWLLLVI